MTMSRQPLLYDRHCPIAAYDQFVVYLTSEQGGCGYTTWSVIRWILSPGPGGRRRAMVTSPAPFWKVERFFNSDRPQRRRSTQREKRGWAAACRCRCSILSGNNWKRCWSSEANAMWTEGLNPSMFSALCSVKKKKRKEKCYIGHMCSDTDISVEGRYRWTDISVGLYCFITLLSFYQ